MALPFAPSKVVFCDVNGDGRADLVSADPVNSTLTIMLGNGDGNFGEGHSYAAGLAPTGVATVDTNGDGTVDLAAVGLAGNFVSVLSGNGDGTFGSAVTFDAGASSDSLIAADVDNDGHPDLLIANKSGDTVSVLLNNGSGRFEGRRTFNSGPSPSSLAVSDLDGDGRLDLVVGNGGSGTVSVLPGDGAGEFGTPRTFAAGGNASAITLSDLNSDGNADCVVDDGSGFFVGVLLGNGNGTFQQQQTYSTGNRAGGGSIAVSDANGDGKPDLAVVSAAFSSERLGVMLGNGDGTFGRQQFFFGTKGASQVAVTDLNRDAKPDLIVWDRHSPTLTVFTAAPPIKAVLAGGLPDSVPAGKKFKAIHLKVRIDSGGGATFNGKVKVRAYLSAGTEVTSDSVLVKTASKKLKVKGGGSTAFGIITIRSLPPGVSGSLFVLLDVSDASGLICSNDAGGFSVV